MKSLGLAETAEQWVARACACADILELAQGWVARTYGMKNKVHHCVKHLHVVDGIAYGVDSFRMHWAATQFPDGTYDPVMFTPLKKKYELPNFMRLKAFEHYESVDIAALLSSPCSVEGKPYYRCSRGHQVSARRIHAALNGKRKGYLQFVENRYYGVSEFGGFLVSAAPDSIE